MSQPSSAEFLAFLDECRRRGAVRVSWGMVTVDFDRPLDAGRRELPTESLTAAEREELEDAREERRLAEELGNA